MTSIAESQSRKERILRLLNMTFERNPTVVVGIKQVHSLFEDDWTVTENSQINVEIVSLKSDGLIEQVPLPHSGGGIGSTGLRLTNKGRNFCLHNFPWNKLDEFAE